MDIINIIYPVLLLVEMLIYSLLAISKAGIGFNRGFRNKPASRWFMIFFVELGLLIFVTGCMNPFVIAHEQFRLPHLVLMIVLIAAEIAAGGWCVRKEKEDDTVRAVSNG